MPAARPNILIVEDVAPLAQTYRAYLGREGYNVITETDARSALQRLETDPISVLLLDVNLPDMSGIEILRSIKRRGLPVETVVMTSDGSIARAVEAMREGAFDFIVKPFAADRLRVTIRNALERRRLTEAVDKLRDEAGRDRFCGFIGASLAMQSVYAVVRNAAPSKATVFITGESGTGKEVCAEAIHRLSKRSAGPFVAINCAAIPRDLLESEVFGHVKGAYTGATSDRQGAALLADGGTLFLDEIGEMDLAFQAKMLRFLQTGTVQRIGDDRARQVDVRIVCATNRDPRAEVAAGRFREDLFYRLFVIPIEMPALREREQDVLLLAREFLAGFAQEDGKSFRSFSAAVEDVLLSHKWPGNVRELQNVVRQIVVMGNGDEVGLEHLPAELRAAAKASAPGTGASAEIIKAPARASAECRPAEIVPLEDVIDQTIEAAIAACDGSIPRAAAALKVSPSTIYRRLQSRTRAA